MASYNSQTSWTSWIGSVDVLRSLTRLNVLPSAASGRSWTWPRQWNTAPPLNRFNNSGNVAGTSSLYEARSAPSLDDFVNYFQNVVLQDDLDYLDHLDDLSSTCSSSSYGRIFN